MKETIPKERFETVRQEIIRLLEGRKLPVSAISKEIGKSEREIIDHLDQIGRSGILIIFPAECANCGFTFRDRHRSRKPGKCPSCKSTHIYPPAFTVKLKLSKGGA